MFLWLIYFIQVLDSFFQFFFYVGLAFLAGGKLNEKVSHARILEKSLFSLLAVFVHCVSYKLEVNGASADHLLDVLLLEVMAEND